MRLYTEEQVKEAMLKYALGSIPTMKEVFDSLTPIELPSDEEIEKYLKSFPYTKHLDDGRYNDGVIDGAELAIEWMKEQILNQNK